CRLFLGDAQGLAAIIWTETRRVKVERLLGRKEGSSVARGQQRNQPLIREAGQALDQFKYEVAQEIAQTPNDAQAQLLQQYLSGQTGGYGGGIPSRVWGAVGGHIVRGRIAAAEQTVSSRAQSAVQQS